MQFKPLAAALPFLLLLGLTAAAPIPNAARGAETTLEAPTLLCLGVRWTIFGDANRNATVTLEYRPATRPSADWRRALPLFRIERAALLDPLPEGSTLFAGSVFDLSPNTAYELRLRLADPDGGDETRVFQAHTRAEPTVPPNAPIRFVIPGDGGGSGATTDPFRGLAAAQAAARPGDILQLRPGVYRGAFEITRSGEPGKPIVWRGEPGAILDGGGADRCVTATAARDLFIEDLEIRNGRWGIVAHGASDLVVRRCHIHHVTSGITATRNDPVMRNLFLADNLIEGPSTWPRTRGIEDTEGIEVVGEGHVVCYNRIHGFGDAISIFRPPGRAIDFYNNEISECTDDGIEMDYGQQNVRSFRNRLTNCFQGISTQPLHGGPCYIFRNALFNIEVEPFKMHNNPSGLLMLHNTCAKAGIPLLLYTPAKVTNTYFRNNLFVGTRGSYALEISPPMEEADWDYDGYGGGPFTNFASWNRQRYPTLDALRRSGAIEAHAVQVDAATVFARARPPEDFHLQQPVAANDLRLRSGSAAIDAGQPLPNLNDGFAGRAPDLGAYELGQPLPHYGPRPARSVR